MRLQATMQGTIVLQPHGLAPSRTHAAKALQSSLSRYGSGERGFGEPANLIPSSIITYQGKVDRYIITRSIAKDGGGEKREGVRRRMETSDRLEKE